MTTSNEHNNAPAVPQGWKLVPVEPSPEMMEAMPGMPAIGAPGDMDLKNKGWSLKAIQNRHRWIAALAATPAPAPAQEVADMVPRAALHEVERERDYYKSRAQTMYEHQEGEAWYWQGDGEDHPESWVNSLPVVIRADQLRELMAKPAQGVVIPQGYEVHELPPDYSGPVWIESQVRQLARQTACASQPTTDAGVVEDVYAQGWIAAAGWAMKPDLIADVDSPAYTNERDGRLMARGYAARAKGGKRV